MKHRDTSRHLGFFRVILSTRSAQAAMMVLRPGQSSSDQPENEHPRCEQWLYVISGRDRATTSSRSLDLRQGALLLVEKNEPHQITCTGRQPLVTLNLYVPRAYTSGGKLRPGLKPRRG